MKKYVPAECASCPLPSAERACFTPKGRGAKGCPTLGKKDLCKKAKEAYGSPEVMEFARQASIQEGQCYLDRDKEPFVRHPAKPRILELCEFAKKMGYVRLGLVFCMGLVKEAAIVNRILQNQGFDVVSVICKAGSEPKEFIGIKADEKVCIGAKHESMCNPVLQAMVVNEAKVDFNILLGLCVGHDSLFFKFADAPTTVLAVKDRVTGHNPLAAIYTYGSYNTWLDKA
ncbi:MAG: DUF1847 domain-containing protein [Syntrophales bacterium]|nr:DUF1847 domain-containing protein [Syntrophales bacterium]